jgi:hypothetical protein
VLVEVDITFWRDVVGSGPDVLARMYDRRTGTFYGGSGATPLEAIAWCLDEYVQRGVLGRSPMMARTPAATPGEFREYTTADEETAIALQPSVFARHIDHRDIKPENRAGCFESHIPTRPAPQLHGELAPPPSRTRRSRR